MKNRPKVYNQDLCLLMTMKTIFTLAKWFNENHTAEEFIAYIFVLFSSASLASTQLLTLEQSGFIFMIGLVLCFDFYCVTRIQRWYVRKTEKKFEDFDYSEIMEEQEDEYPEFDH